MRFSRPPINWPESASGIPLGPTWPGVQRKIGWWIRLGVFDWPLGLGLPPGACKLKVRL
jgi:hypothetical protein